jgi:hypothetical protein
MEVGDFVIYKAYAAGGTFEVYGEVVGFEEVDWTQSGIEAAVRFPNPDGTDHWIQYIDPKRLSVMTKEEKNEKCR